MKISKKQQEEIDFYCKSISKPFEPTIEEIEEYINETVHGINQQRNNVWEKRNRISESKRFYDITISMWKEDLTRGMLGVDELKEDFKDFPYGIRLVNSIVSSISSKYRKEILTKAVEGGLYTTLAFDNFPEIFEKLYANTISK